MGVNTLLIIFFLLLFLFWEESQQQVSVMVLCLEDVLFDYHDGLNYLRHYRLLELDELGHLFTCFGLNYLSHHRLPELGELGLGLNYLRHYRLIELGELGHLLQCLGLNHLRNLFTCFSLDSLVSVLLLTL